MMSTEFAENKRKKRSTSSRFLITFQIFLLFFSFGVNSMKNLERKPRRNSINLRFVFQKFHFVIGEFKKIRVKIDCSCRKSMKKIKKLFCPLSKSGKFVFIVSVLKGFFLSSSMNSIETALIMEIEVTKKNCETLFLVFVSNEMKMNYAKVGNSQR